jgi:hypothetical protein
MRLVYMAIRLYMFIKNHVAITCVKKSIGAKCASYKKTLEAKLMVNTETTQGGKSFVC